MYILSFHLCFATNHERPWSSYRGSSGCGHVHAVLNPLFQIFSLDTWLAPMLRNKAAAEAAEAAEAAAAGGGHLVAQ